VEASRKILVETKAYYRSLLEFVSPYLHPGIDLYKENSTEKEILLETLPKTHREFFKHFIMCQLFAEKVEDLLLELAEKEQNAKSMMDRLNEKIDALELERQKAQETLKQAQLKIRECDERITSLKDAKSTLLDPSRKKKQFKLFNFSSMHT
jgi:hypothetical protein